MIDRPRRIWLRSFYGFSPEEDGYIGWTDAGARDRMLQQVETGDLFMIYGAASASTNRVQRHRVLGFLQVEAEPIRDFEKASALGQERKLSNGWADKWTYALPVTRAWRATESILLERIAPTTYRPEAGQAIAVWSPPLLPDEVDRALRIKVSEVNVFGEEPIEETSSTPEVLAQSFSPSRAFPGSFGERTSTYEDGPTSLYLARFEGDSFALLGQPKPYGDKSVLTKIGVSNSPERRCGELNSGIPPAALGRWSIPLFSVPFATRKLAEDAERQFKLIAETKLRSVGKEFFFGDWTTAQVLFSSIPGVSRFGR